MRSTPFRSRNGFAVVASTAFAGLAGLAALAGCDSAPKPQDRADYTTTLNRYYQGRPLCVWPHSVTFPVEVGRPGAQVTTPVDLDPRGFAALADAGLLVPDRAAQDAALGKQAGEAPKTQIYDLTPEGRSALNREISQPNTGNFCYGRRTVASIDSDRKHSTTTELIEYQYHVAEAAAWAQKISIQRAFPQVVEELRSAHKAQVMLLDTTDGWEVSGTPVTSVPPNAGAQPTTLAKAKALLHRVA